MTASKRISVVSYFRSIRASDIAIHVGVFFACFLTAKLGQYLFYTYHTSPAVFWPPYGIALGAVLVWGYRMWFPIALAELFAAATAGTMLLPVEIAAVIGQTAQPLLIAYVLNRLGFEHPAFRLRDAFLIIGAAVVGTAIAPSVSTLAQFLTHTLSTTPSATWTRAWAGGILSILIFTPLMTTWFPWRNLPFKCVKRTEIELSFGLLLLTTIFLFWTPYASGLGVSSIYILLAALMWIALRLEPRNATLSFAVFTILAVTGTLLINPTGGALQDRLLNDELFIEFIVMFFLVFCAIIEDRRIVKRRLEESVRDLEIAVTRISREDKAKTEFIATLAHELRNPLSPVVSALELLKFQEIQPESQEIITAAEQQLQVMRRLLDDLLEVARITQSSFKLQREPVEISAILERSIASVKHLFENRSHTLMVDITCRGHVLNVDAVRLQQIIANLLNNAAKYTPPGGIIEVSAFTENGKVAIRVKDNGFGIPPESIKDIFEPFRQIRPTADVGTGLGIGLSLTKRLVEMHGGLIVVTSPGSGLGSTFTVYLPYITSEQASAITHTNMQLSSPIASRKILVIDDNEAAAKGLGKLLELKGHIVQLAPDGTSGIAVARSFRPDFIFLDIGLPDIDGYQVARTLKKGETSAKLIALSGYGQDEDKQKAKDAGFDAHLTKPVGIAQVEETIVSFS